MSSLTVAFDAATGAVRWSGEGLDTICDVEVTDPGSVDDDPLLACAWQSGQRIVNPTDDSSTDDKPVMALTQLDLATGQDRWTAPIGELPVKQGDADTEFAVLPDGAIVIDRVNGPVRVALADGALSPVDPDVVA